MRKTTDRPNAPRSWRAGGAVAALAVGIGSLLPVGIASAAPSVGGDATATYTEQAAPAVIGSGVSVTGGGSYDGGNVTFAVGGASTTENLGLGTDAQPVTDAGAVSIVNRTVYLGNGSTADVIGSVSGTQTGQAGAPLTVAFTSPFDNPGFETGDLSGWTAMNQVVNLGVTPIAGHVPADTSTYPGNTPNGNDDEWPSNPGAFTSTVQSQVSSEGTKGLRLVSSGMTVASGCDVVHGPAVYSEPFTAAGGDTIYFDWRAYAGNDNYHVFGYIVDADGNQTEVLDSTGGGTTPWATKQTVIPQAGEYRFVFVAGTHDMTCGQAAGASLVIDNVRVFGNKVDDAVVQQIARRLRYSNTSDTPAASRTVSITATSPADGTAAGQIAVAVTGVNDAPALSAVSASTYTNTEAQQQFPTATGQLSATDPEGDGLSYGIVGGQVDPATVGGTAYTHSARGSYGILRVDQASGAWAFVPDRGAIDARTEDGADSFQFTASDGTLTTAQGYQAVVDVQDSRPGAPTRLTASAAPAAAVLSWSAPAWTGGSPMTGYLVERSTDGTTWTTVSSTATSPYRVTGLADGVPAQLRVSARNVTGTGTPTATVTVTPFSAPAAPSLAGVVPGSRRLAVTFVPPAADGGDAITGYQYSVDGGATWHAVQSDPSSRQFVIDGLRNGSTYAVQMRAVNRAGGGAASATVSATPTPTPVLAPGASTVTELEPGTSRLLVDGVPQPVTISTRGGTLTMTGDGFTVGLGAVAADGTRLAVDDQGRVIATDGGKVQVAGEGFRPGSTVDVWLFSTPRLLGEVTVGAQGTFASALALPAGVELGAHTVQLNGVSHDGELRSLSTGIVVQAKGSDVPALAYTGVEVLPLIAVGGVLMLVGAGAVQVARRRSVVG
jgi:hypothetical protein